MSGKGSPSEVLEQLLTRAQSICKRVIFPEASDPRVQQAIEILVAQGICIPIVLHRESAPEGCEAFWAREDADTLFDEATQAYTLMRAGKGITFEHARHTLQSDPLLLCAVLVHTGYVESGLAGAITPTPDVLRACLRGIGLSPSSKLVSSAFIIDHSYRLMTFGDCAVNPEPDAAQLAQIAVDSAHTHLVLTATTPKVALLSFSTHGSAEHSSVDKVRQALDIARSMAPDLEICGELQLDAALLPEIGSSKARGSQVAGHANVLIFPDLNSGNIAYKIAQRLGGAHAIGPILQGLDKPWLDLSRGCSSSDIVHAAAMAAILAAQ
ncbi:phosphate acyltransferase [Haliea sp.]